MVDTRESRRQYAQFRKKLLDKGFTMLQFSVYAKHLASEEAADSTCGAIIGALPPKRIRNLHRRPNDGPGQIGQDKLPSLHANEVPKPKSSSQKIIRVNPRESGAYCCRTRQLKQISFFLQVLPVCFASRYRGHVPAQSPR